MNTHEQYEELCALAASGQATAQELNDLRAHLDSCPDCRNAAYDFTQLSAQALSQIAAKRSPHQIPSGMTQRFVARAHSEGIEINREAVHSVVLENRRWVYPTLAAALAVVVLIAAIVTIGRRRVFQLTEDPRSASNVSMSAAPSNAIPQTVKNEAQDHLSAAQSKVNSLEETLRSQRQELEAQTRREDSLSLRLANAEQQNIRAASEKNIREARIAQLDDDLAKSKLEKNADQNALTLQGDELRELRKKLSDQNEALSQQEELV